MRGEENSSGEYVQSCKPVAEGPAEQVHASFTGMATLYVCEIVGLDIMAKQWYIHDLSRYITVENWTGGVMDSKTRILSVKYDEPAQDGDTVRQRTVVR